MPPLSLSDLCRHIKNNIGEDIHLKSKEISIDWLNELLKVPYLYNAIIKNVIRLQDLPRDIKKMYVETAAIREKKRYSQLTRKEQNVIIPLNRLLLENAYPSMTPKRPKDYSKRYTLNTVKNALKDIAEERGLKI